MRLFQRLAVLFDRSLSLFSSIAGALIILAMISINVDVLMRFFFGKPLHNAVFALTEFSILFITFLGTAWLLRMDGHVKMDFITIRLGDRNRVRFELFSCAIGLFISLFLLVYGLHVTYGLCLSGEDDLFKLAGFPKAIPISIIPLGSLMLWLQFLRDLVHRIRYLRHSKEAPDLNHD